MCQIKFCLLQFIKNDLFWMGEAYPVAEGDPVHPVIFSFESVIVMRELEW